VRLSLPVALLLTSAAIAAPVDYAREIKPILQERCYACHGALKQNAKLRLDSGEFIRKGGASGPAVVARKAAESLLIEKVSDPDEHSRMPPEGQPLTRDQIARLKAWIDEGATSPADEKPEPDPRDHWAFRAPVRPPVPRVELGKNPVDAFLAAEWTKHSLSPQKPADRRLLLRRVYLDLIGLPPTQEQIDAFLKDTSTNAYEKVVTRLLESPQYGERWGRHFMDIWRYSDWWGLGAEVRNSQKHIWHWRDWIVESLNKDKGYDQMVREMLAADELYPTDTEKLRATGYLARQYFIFNRTTWLDETVEHTAKAFLGLTMNCTKCHDHKYDPISHTDYYKMRAFFEPYQVRTDMVPGQIDFDKAGVPRSFDCNLEAVTYRHQRGDDRNPITSQKILPGLPAVLGGELKIEPVTLPPEAHSPHLRPFVEENYIKAAEARIVAAREVVSKAKAALAQAEKLARSETKPELKKDAPAASGKVLAKDDFAKANDTLWDLGPGTWKYEKGALTQSLPGEERSRIRLKQSVPADFAAKFKFTFTGGEPWRSVGLSFDVAGENETLVYASANTGAPKLQIAYKQGGNYVYPPEGMLNRPFKVGDTVELSVRIRGQALNIDVNGEHALAFRLPNPRRTGAIELITYAATAEFKAFELAELPSAYKLVEPTNSKDAKARPTTPEQARLALIVAEKSLAAAEAEMPAIRARFAAERAKHATPQAADFATRAKVAAKLDKQIAQAKAEEELAKAELELSQAGTPQKAAIEKKRDAAKAAVAAASKALENPGDKYTVPRGSLKTKENNLETDDSRAKPFPTTSTGRRAALARWITDRQNPLAARVAVNHVWARHFGRPLVATVFNFGRKGATPTHPELLDWLAVEFMDHGWSLKHLHRLMVTSAAYQLSSSAERGTRSAEPGSNTPRSGFRAPRLVDEENRYYWRMNPTRMESQVVRDSMLHLAGQLDLTPAGPPIDVNQQADSKRRSLYFVHSHNDHHKFLMQFDDAAVLECYRRTESIVPQQALTLTNSKFAMTMADAIASRLATPQATDAEYAQRAFEFILGSTPTPDEKATCLEAMTEWRKILKEQKHPDPAAKARANLVGALLNHNDYVTVR
jgi:hypothetical protein